MNGNEKLLVTLDGGGVKRITFNNPARRNAIDFGMFEAFARAVEESAADASRVVVITGAGDAFCSGLDLGSISPAELASMDLAASVRELINPPVRRMRELGKPFVARVAGPAAGIGFSYVLASDFVVAYFRHDISRLVRGVARKDAMFEVVVRRSVAIWWRRRPRDPVRYAAFAAPRLWRK